MTEKIVEVCVEIGRAAVDSGMLVVGDPCYLLRREEYDELCDEPWSESLCHELTFQAGHTGRGVAIVSPEGGGIFPVVLVLRDWRRHETRRCTANAR
jgi:hypothetical protein